MRRLAVLCVLALGFLGLPVPDAYGLDEIRVLSVDNYEEGGEPSFSPFATVTLQVKDLGTSMEVGLIESNAKGDFYREAYYKGPAQYGYHIWRVRVALKELEPFRFYAKVKIGDREFVDDNEGQMFRYFPAQGMAFYDGYMLSNKTPLLVRHFTPDGLEHQWADFAVAVKNLAYAKKVEIVYFINGDPSDHTFPLHYRGRVDFGETRQAEQPQVPADVEMWAGRLMIDAHVSDFFYYIRFEVEGKTFVDTNYGRYYTLSVDPS